MKLMFFLVCALGIHANAQNDPNAANRAGNLAHERAYKAALRTNEAGRLDHEKAWKAAARGGEVSESQIRLVYKDYPNSFDRSRIDSEVAAANRKDYQPAASNQYYETVPSGQYYPAHASGQNYQPATNNQHYQAVPSGQNYQVAYGEHDGARFHLF